VCGHTTRVTQAHLLIAADHGMDRFVEQWQRQAKTPSGATSTWIDGPDGDNVEDEDDMADFIVDDAEEDDEDAYDAAERDYDEELSAAPQHKRIKLQPKSTSSSSKKKKPPPPQSASNSSSASSAPTSTAVKQHRRIEEKLTAKQQFKQQQQDRKQQEFTRTSSMPARPRPAPAAAASPSPPPATPSPDAAAASIPAPSQPARVSSSTAASSSSAAAGAASAATPVPAAIAVPAAVAVLVTVLPRKRKHLLIDDDEEEEESKEASEQQRLVDSIDDSFDIPPFARGLSSALDSAEPSRDPSNRRQRNVLGMLEALRCNGVPFAGAHLARLERLKATRSGEDDHAAPDQALGESIGSTRALGSTGPSEESFPFYSTSGFRSAQVEHQGFMHHALRLLWSGMSPVQDWSLCGSFGEGVGVDARPNIAGVSYVNNMEFDGAGVLLAAASNNAKLSVYDFDTIWMAGREVERSKRSRVLRGREERARAEQLLRRPSSPPRAGKWRLNQAPPSVRPAASHKQTHEALPPIFSMDLHPDARGPPAAAQSAQMTLKQIDAQHWNPYNHNEIAVSSQRNNQIFMYVSTQRRACRNLLDSVY
jgi:hypothetical protein